MSPAGCEGQVIDRSARRREKSRDAARCRRQQESDTYNEICNVIPIPSKTLSQMDRSSVMRLLISFMKLRRVVDKVSVEHEEVKLENCLVTPSDDEYVNSLNGFVLVLSSEFDILYVSANVKQYIGINSLDLIGQNLFGYTHEGDHGAITKCMKISPDNTSDHHSFFMRMKSTLTSSGKNVNLKSATYKVLKCDGIVNHLSDKQDSYMVTYCEPIPHPSNIEMVLDRSTFLSQHSLDMKFTFCDNERVGDLLGYSEKDMTGKSFYGFCHTVDLKSVESSMQSLFRLGQVTTDCYRMLAKYGGYVWVVSEATIINNPRNQQPSYIVCVHHIISEIIEGSIALSSAQMISSDIENQPAIKREREMAEEYPPQDNSENVFFDSTNLIFSDTIVDIPTMDLAGINDPVNDQVPNAKALECMAQNAPSIGDQFDLFQLDSTNCTIEEGNSLGHNAPSIGDPQWDCSAQVHDGKIEDLFTDVNVNNIGCQEQLNFSKSPCEMILHQFSPQALVRQQSPPIHYSPTKSPPQSSPPTYMPGESPPYGSPYQVVGVPRPQYQRQMQMQHQPVKRHIQNITCNNVLTQEDGYICGSKKAKVAPQFGGGADCAPRYETTGRSFPDAKNVLLNGKYANSNLAALLLNPGDKAGMVYDNSQHMEDASLPSGNSAFSWSRKTQQKNSLLPVLSLHDCEVNAPVNDRFTSVDWMALSSSLCIQ